MYKKFIHLFVLSCKRATFLIEKQLHTLPSPLEKLQLQTHLSLCKYCVDYKQKAMFLDKLMIDKMTGCENDNVFSEQELISLKDKFKSTLSNK